ncbi:MAG: FHA domain-containing protein [Acidobacteria bacterium]|nr:FHA domain-containing protein [Acidobacteriota bacterium]
MGWLWLGLLIGLLVGAGAVALIIRSVGGLTGTDLRSVGRLIADGLRPGSRRDGVAAQRALARRLKRAASRTASGRRVAADALTVHVSPEDHDAIGSALGIGTAEVRLSRDISLRPHQAFVRMTTSASGQPPEAAPLMNAVPMNAAPMSTGPVAYPAAPPESFSHAPIPPIPPRSDEAVTDVLSRAELADATTDVLPRALLEDATVTAVFPAGLLLGDLVVVHGTDVRTVSPAQGVLRIGRGSHNDLVLDRPGVGRDHLVIEARGDAWWIVPGTSQGGTKVDGATLDVPTPVRSGTTLELGRGVRIRLNVEPA